jgi:hypothetical protein
MVTKSKAIEIIEASSDVKFKNLKVQIEQKNTFERNFSRIFVCLLRFWQKLVSYLGADFNFMYIRTCGTYRTQRCISAFRESKKRGELKKCK